MRTVIFNKKSIKRSIFNKTSNSFKYEYLRNSSEDFCFKNKTNNKHNCVKWTLSITQKDTANLILQTYLESTL